MYRTFLDPTAWLLFFFLAALAPSSRGGEYSFQNGSIAPSGGVYESQAGTYLREYRTPNANFGASTRLAVGYRNGDSIYRSILRFDNLKANIPESEQVSEASLTLRNAAGRDQRGDVQVNVYVIKAANAGWVAGGADGKQELGACSWNYKVTAKPLGNSEEWIGGPGLGQPGEGYEATLIGSVTLVKGSDHVVTISSLGPAVQAWLDHPESNAGLLLRAANESDESFAYIFGGGSSEMDSRPLLNVSTRNSAHTAPSSK